jgi:hypothetical protein
MAWCCAISFAISVLIFIVGIILVPKFAQHQMNHAGTMRVNSISIGLPSFLPPTLSMQIDMEFENVTPVEIMVDGSDVDVMVMNSQGTYDKLATVHMDKFTLAAGETPTHVPMDVTDVEITTAIYDIVLEVLSTGKIQLRTESMNMHLKPVIWFKVDVDMNRTLPLADAIPL